MKNVKPFFSIIIPMYNSEKYIRRCLESVIDQEFNDYEVIVIDDGSTDETIEIISKYVDSELNIELIQQNNAGVSAARNTALNYATGEYILFLDSDDYLIGNSMSRLNEILKKNKSIDILLFNYCEKRPNEIKNHILSPKFLGKISKETAIESIFYDVGGYLGYCWNKVYKHSILYDKSFDEQVTYLEDMLFNISCIMDANIIMGIDNQLYVYRWREDSVVHTFDSSHMTFFAAINKIENKVPAKFKDLINTKRKMAYIEFASSIIFKDKDKYLELKKLYKKNKKVKELNSPYLSKTAKTSLYLANINFDLSVILFKLKRKLEFTSNKVQSG